MAKTKKDISQKTFDKYKLVIDEWFVNGFNGCKAYQKFYPKSSNKTAEQRFSQISSIVKVSKYKDEKQTKASDKLEITFESQLKDLQNVKFKTLTAKEYNAYINAIKEQNKLLGFYEADNKQKSSLILETREERDAFLKSIKDKILKDVDV